MISRKQAEAVGKLFLRAREAFYPSYDEERLSRAEAARRAGITRTQARTLELCPVSSVPGEAAEKYSRAVGLDYASVLRVAGILQAEQAS